MKFKARVIPSGNATGVEIPEHVVKALRSGARPPITVTINGHVWRSRVALMRGQCLVGISAANRVASGIAEGDLIVVDLQLDTAPRGSSFRRRTSPGPCATPPQPARRSTTCPLASSASTWPTSMERRLQRPDSGESPSWSQR
jgi:hypothetical protein